MTLVSAPRSWLSPLFRQNTELTRLHYPCDRTLTVQVLYEYYVEDD